MVADRWFLVKGNSLRLGSDIANRLGSLRPPHQTPILCLKDFLIKQGTLVGFEGYLSPLSLLSS